MQWFDWVLALVPLLGVLAVAAYTQRYVKSVADFMSGNRLAGRYLLANARAQAVTGISNAVSSFQGTLKAGFVLAWWHWLIAPIGMLAHILGFVSFRYRETRALTLGQFFEMRYSRSFRLYMGCLGFLAGVLNYGIFPAVASRMLVYFLGLPVEVHLGAMEIPTRLILMGGYVVCAATLMMFGGQITLLVANCLEGMLTFAIYLTVVAVLLWLIGWDKVGDLMKVNEPGKSMLDPWDALKVEDFNIWFALIGVATGLYGTMAWQSQSGFMAAPRTAHEGRMSGIIGGWRGMIKPLALTVMALTALAFLKHPAFQEQRREAVAVIQSIGTTSDHSLSDRQVNQLRRQMEVPIALRFMLPAGIKGLLVAVLLMGLMSSDSCHMHSWGSILVQDVILPLRKSHLSPEQHLKYLRLAIAGVAGFAFLFSWLVPLADYIAMWWAVTGAFFVGGAGAAIIGGLYWKKGTTAGAWTAAITGSVLAGGGIIAPYIWPAFPLNGQYINLIACGAALTAYVVVSRLTCRQDFNLDQMLHRGAYAVEGGGGGHVKPVTGWREYFRLKRILGLNDNFTRSDRFFTYLAFFAGLAFTILAVAGTIWNGLGPKLGLSTRWTKEWWWNFWTVVSIWYPLCVSVVAFFWFTIGGVIDIKAFFRDLRKLKRDEFDDGTVEKTGPKPKEERI